MKTIILLTICIVLIACGKFSGNYERDARSFTSKELKMVEERVGIPIPSDSRGLNLYNAQAEIDPSFIAKIEISSASSESVFKEIERMPNESISITNYLLQKVTWWRPAFAPVQIERRFFRHPEGDFVDILLCDESGHTILYVDWSSR